MKGQGIVIKIKTNQIDNSLKENIIYLINEINNSGAEAICVNDERIIFNSSIICTENNIEINGSIIQSPFEIKAIGDSRLMYNDLLRPGGYIEFIENNNKKIEVVKDNLITIKKYGGDIKSEYINTVL